MNDIMNATETIRNRYSCRVYQEKVIEEDKRQTLITYLNSLIKGPLDSHIRLSLLAAESTDINALKGLGTYGFIKRAAGFIVAAIEKTPYDLEDCGYLTEQAILFATELGLGTCWLGGTFKKSNFAEKAKKTPAESIPVVIAIGYAAKNPTPEHLARPRLPGEQLFFDRRFGKPLNQEDLGLYSTVLEAVRQAPSASNKQPWRIIRIKDDFHFYLQRTKGYGKGSLLFSLLKFADLQRIDMGIAMNHFELTARQLGLNGHWEIGEPDVEKPNMGAEYTISWKGSRN